MEHLKQVAEALALLPGNDGEHARLMGIAPSHISAWYGVIAGRLVAVNGRVGKNKYRMPVPADVERARLLVLTHKRVVCSVMEGWGS